jgi:signal transduction histidine kinase
MHKFFMMFMLFMMYVVIVFLSLFNLLLHKNLSISTLSDGQIRYSLWQGIGFWVLILDLSLVLPCLSLCFMLYHRYAGKSNIQLSLDKDLKAHVHITVNVIVIVTNFTAWLLELLTFFFNKFCINKCDLEVKE